MAELHRAFNMHRVKSPKKLTKPVKPALSSCLQPLTSEEERELADSVREIRSSSASCAEDESAAEVQPAENHEQDTIQTDPEADKHIISVKNECTYDEMPDWLKPKAVVKVAPPSLAEVGAGLSALANFDTSVVAQHVRKFPLVAKAFYLKHGQISSVSSLASKVGGGYSSSDEQTTTSAAPGALLRILTALEKHGKKGVPAGLLQ
ncbi:unnamed protein product [Amoebophrya sp. A25]|nr:unnamed protein product [Amoebophrya sp. A25]|eukprot:GSA25T00016654001.1